MTNPIGPFAGVDLTVTSTTPQFTVGAVELHDSGGMYMYVQAGEAIAACNVLAIDMNGTNGATAWLVKNTAAAAYGRIGVSDGGLTSTLSGGAIASGSYGWVKISGLARGTALALCAAGATLYTSSTPGYVDDQASGFQATWQKLANIIGRSSIGQSSAVSGSTLSMLLDMGAPWIAV